MTILISLVGEQPIPNLLPVRYLQPDKLILLATSHTKKTALRLRALVTCETYIPLVAPYAILETRDTLDRQLEEIRHLDEPLIFNFTGGTKNMALAAYMVANRHAAPLIYLQTEGRQSLLHKYRFDADELRLAEQTPLPTLITNHDYIFAHVGDCLPAKPDHETSDELGKHFEKQVHDVLLPYVDELTPGVRPTPDLEIDLIVRCGNQVGLIEIKSGQQTRKAIEQLITAGAREYFGTYTEKILVSNFADWANRSNQKQLADEHHIKIIETTSFSRKHPVIDTQERQNLIHQVCITLGRK